MELQGTERYYLDPELGAIVNMALVMEKSVAVVFRFPVRIEI